MKFYSFIIFCLLINGRLSSQEVPPDPIFFNVTYEFIHFNNSNSKVPAIKEMVLSVGKTSSRFIDASVYLRSKAPKPKTSAGPKRMVATGKPAVAVNNSGPIISEALFQYPKTRKLQILSFIGSNNYSAEFLLPEIKWELKKEYKQIADFKCQKATGEFAGRSYIVWFAPELPFQTGPYKFSGLPGLILEVEDVKGEVRFLVKSISKESDPSVTVSNLGTSTPVKITALNYMRAIKLYKANPGSYMQQQLPSGSPKVSIISVDDDSKGSSQKFVENPVELKGIN